MSNPIQYIRERMGEGLDSVAHYMHDNYRAAARIAMVSSLALAAGCANLGQDYDRSVNGVADFFRPGGYSYKDTVTGENIERKLGESDTGNRPTTERAVGFSEGLGGVLIP